MTVFSYLFYVTHTEYFERKRWCNTVGNMPLPQLYGNTLLASNSEWTYASTHPSIPAYSSARSWQSAGVYPSCLWENDRSKNGHMYMFVAIPRLTTWGRIELDFPHMSPCVSLHPYSDGPAHLLMSYRLFILLDEQSGMFLQGNFKTSFSLCCMSSCCKREELAELRNAHKL